LDQDQALHSSSARIPPDAPVLSGGSRHEFGAFPTNDDPAADINEVLELQAVHRHPEVSTGDWMRVYKQAYALTRNPADAEDAAQEAYLRLFQAGLRGGRIESTTAWLRGVLRNVVYQTFHKIRPDLHVALDARSGDGDDETCLADTLVESKESIEDQVIDDRILELALRVISELPEKERECVLMWVRGYSFVHIRNSLGISYKVALTTTRKALAKVRNAIER
jgi:RNA polymerase sigma factor (sigma-70 family)